MLITCGGVGGGGRSSEPRARPDGGRSGETVGSWMASRVQLQVF